MLSGTCAVELDSTVTMETMDVLAQVQGLGGVNLGTMDLWTQV